MSRSLRPIGALVAFFTLLTAIPLLCGGCSPSQARTSGADSASAPGGRTKLVVWGLELGQDSAGLKAQIAEFDKLNPDIELSVLSMGAGSMNPQKLMTSIVGGVPPDVINQDRFTIGDWASRGTFMPLDSYLARESGTDAIRKDDYYPAAWNEAVYKGQVYGIPTEIDDRLLYVNRKVFRDAGLDPNKPPQTWDELTDISKRLTKKNPDGTYARIGFIPNYGNSWLYLYSWQNDGEFMSPDGTKCTLANDRTVDALKYVVGLYDDLGGYDKINLFQSGFQGNADDPFFTGKIGMVITGNWQLGGIARYAPDLDFYCVPAPVPADRLAGKAPFTNDTKFVTWTGGYSYAIPMGAKHPDAAWRFIQYMNSVRGTMTQAKAQKAYQESLGRPYVFDLSASKRLNNVLFTNYAPALKSLTAAQKAFIDILPSAKYRPVTFVGQDLWDAMNRAFDRAVAHAQEPKAALLEQQGLVQKELDRNYSRDSLPVFSMTGPLIAICSLILAALFGAGFWARRGLAHSRMARQEAVAGYLMAAPWILGFLLLTAGPIIVSLLFSFCDYDVLHNPRWVGGGNYATLFGDDRELLLKALGNAGYLAITGIPLGMMTGLAIAMLLNMKVKGVNWYRTAFYIPSIVPGVASAVLWYIILAGDPSKGIINALWKETFTAWFHWAPPGWFSDPTWAKPGLIIQGLWGAGGGMILWLAGLQGVPPSLYEAADLDGASAFSKFRHVTLPIISPYIFFNLIMGTIGAVQEFDREYILAGGQGGYGPLDSLVTPVLYLFNNAFRYFKMGYASAIAWIIFAIILALTGIQWWAQKRWVHYETDQK